jgi:hypothetical protein
MQELNASYQSTYHHSFTDSAIKYCGKSDGIAARKPAAEQKKARRRVQRTLRDAVNKQFATNAGMSFLAENESYSGYQRKRISQSFEYTSSKPSTSKRHVPSEAKLSQYRDIVLQSLHEWPQEVPVNWSELARQCNIPNKNKGQIAKAIASESGIDMSRYNPTRKRHNRPSKAKLPGNEVSMPSMPTPIAIKDDISNLIVTGKLQLGELLSLYVNVPLLTVRYKRPHVRFMDEKYLFASYVRNSSPSMSLTCTY